MRHILRVLVLILFSMCVLQTACQKPAPPAPPAEPTETGTPVEEAEVPVIPDIPAEPVDPNAAADVWTGDPQLPLQNAAYSGGPEQKPVTTWPPAGTTVRCPIIKDDIYSKMGKEKFTNSGAVSRMKLKGQQEYSIFDADISALKGKIITGALLHVKTASPDWPFYRVGVSTVASPWEEGSANGMYKRIEGEACYVQAELGKRDWSFSGSTIMDVVFGRGHTIWKFADATLPNDDGWQSLAVDPRVIAARAADTSYGFFMYDEVGHEYRDNDEGFKYWSNPNRFCYSHEQSNGAPWLEVWVNGEDTVPPAAIEQSKVIRDGFPAGQALVKWITPADEGAGTIGYHVTYTRADGTGGEIPRYLIPAAAGTGSECRMHIQDMPFNAGEEITITIVPVDGAGNRGPAFSRPVFLSETPAVFGIAPSTVQAFALSDNLPAVGGITVGIIDLIDKNDPVSGALLPQQPIGYKGGNHLFSAREKKIRLYAGRNEEVAFQITLEGKASDILCELNFKDNPGLETAISEFGYVILKKDDVQHYVPDPLLPVTGAVSIPSSAGQIEVPDQKHHSLIAEVYIPHQEAPGQKSGTLTVKAGGDELVLAIELNVWDFTLPNKLSFVPEMNSYKTSLSDPAWYRLAHRHRVCINQLPYGWSCSTGLPLTWNGTDFNWSEFDAKAGPMLDGSMFADLPRANEPVDKFYLPFNESWPVDLLSNFTPAYWADESFTSEYAQEMKQAFAALARHFDAKGWHDTLFEYYLNNKVYYRGKTRKVLAGWIFDEPRETQDFWAIRWYGILWHQAIAAVRGNAKLLYRGDVSYSQHGRNMFWGIMDLECLGGANAQKIRQKKDEWVLWEEGMFTNYGSANGLEASNAQPVAWQLQSWAEGAGGVLPWQTFGKEKSWKTADKLSLFYPAADGPHPSVRLKAFRRGQQDTEYMTLLQTAYEQPRFAIERGLKQTIDLSSKIHKTHETDAGTIKYASASPQNLWAFRLAVAAMVDAKHPAYKRSLVEVDVPMRNMNKLPDIGYVPVAPEVEAHEPDAGNFGK